ncbi:MAG: hypothetical protein ACTS6A_00615 [Candidatus Hodgkinia cicadicola]
MTQINIVELSTPSLFLRREVLAQHEWELVASSTANNFWSLIRGTPLLTSEVSSTCRSSNEELLRYERRLTEQSGACAIGNKFQANVNERRSQNQR